ncbi:glycosyltransferase family 2 protein [Geoalkalibacter sp.]|uniref:glycosyltransferase family 2 protein n=1 Tax=Geoalkalibacter sp. TaxID=3041440 RepID=UPI00272E9EF6|nr:glycosyltransferase [Geoalkalibacter sp.]
METVVPLISVIVPAFNAENYIELTISSILCQKNAPAYEIVVVNDGSQDLTGEILKNYGNKIKYIAQENQGVSVARNNAISNSLGEWIAFCDADDIWDPDKLYEQSKLFSEKYDLIHSRCKIIDEDGCPIDARLSPLVEDNNFLKLIEGNFLWTSSVVARKSALLKAGGFPVGQTHAEDYCLWLKIASLGNGIGYIEKPLVAYREHAGGASRNTRKIRIGEAQALEGLLTFLPSDSPPNILNHIRERLFECYFGFGWHQFHEGDMSNAILNFTSAKTFSDKICFKLDGYIFLSKIIKKLKIGCN